MLLPLGFRFAPTDAEAVCLLNQRLLAPGQRETTAPAVIADVNIYEHEPWDLLSRSTARLFNASAAFFFVARHPKYLTGQRASRTTPLGYWKATGKDRPIRGQVLEGERRPAITGYKKTYTYFRGRAPGGEKTSWMMVEYRVANAAARPASQPPSATSAQSSPSLSAANQSPRSGSPLQSPAVSAPAEAGASPQPLVLAKIFLRQDDGEEGPEDRDGPSDAPLQQAHGGAGAPSPGVHPRLGSGPLAEPASPQHAQLPFPQLPPPLTSGHWPPVTAPGGLPGSLPSAGPPSSLQRRQAAEPGPQPMAVDALPSHRAGSGIGGPGSAHRAAALHASAVAAPQVALQFMPEDLPPLRDSLATQPAPQSAHGLHSSLPPATLQLLMSAAGAPSSARQGLPAAADGAAQGSGSGFQMPLGAGGTELQRRVEAALLAALSGGRPTGPASAGVPWAALLGAAGSGSSASAAADAGGTREPARFMPVEAESFARGFPRAAGRASLTGASSSAGSLNSHPGHSTDAASLFARAAWPSPQGPALGQTSGWREAMGPAAQLEAAPGEAGSLEAARLLWPTGPAGRGGAPASSKLDLNEKPGE